MLQFIFSFSQVLTSFVVLISDISKSNNYGKIIGFVKVSGFNAMSTALLCLRMVHTGLRVTTGAC